MNRKSYRGFSLVEVVIAIGITSFCLIAIFGLLPVGINATNNSVRQTAASGLGTSILEDLVTLAASTNSIASRYGLTFPTNGPAQTNELFLSEDGEITSLALANYRATLVLSPDTTSSAHPVFCRVMITWPAQANVEQKQYAGSYEAVTTLLPP